MTAGRGTACSIVVPAHDERDTLPALLRGLLEHGGDAFEIVVVCNGCRDDTAAVARESDPAVTVLETPTASKHAAMRLGDSVVTSFPRLYVDADVELHASDVHALCRALERDGVAAAGPQRVLDSTGARWPVRWYYDVWEALPAVRSGLFGRGVVAVSRAGHARVRDLPGALSDDLAVSEAFAPHERVVVDAARVVVRTPRTVRDLVRRRVRVVTGVVQLDRRSARSDGARTTPAVLRAIVRQRPSHAPRVAVFVAVSIAARLGARRAVAAGDYTTWLRDDSSRRPMPGPRTTEPAPRAGNQEAT